MKSREHGASALLPKSAKALAVVAWLFALGLLACCLQAPAGPFEHPCKAWADEPGAEDQSSEAQEAKEGNLVDPTQRADNSFIYDTTIESLFDQASLHDERTVQVVGEVIGDKVSADGNMNCWITLTSTEEDNKSSISVLMSEEAAGQIDQFGRYGVTGTTLQVRGIYHQACSEHSGLPDIHATDSAAVTRGQERPDRFSARTFAPGTILVLVGLALMGLYYFARERTR